MMTLTFRRGATIRFGIDFEGDASAVTTVSFTMRKLVPGRTELSGGEGEGIPLDASARAATDDVPAGWNATLPAAESADLALGVYQADAVVEETDGSVTIEGIKIKIVEPASLA